MYVHTLIPAYGRDYQTAEEVQAAWNAGKDFQITSMGPHFSQYVNINDFKDPVVRLNIRYRRQTRIHVIEIKEPR